MIARLALVGSILLALGGASAHAHVFEVTEVLIVLQARGTYTIDILLDADALALGVSPATDSAQNVDELLGLSPARFEAAVERARDTIRRRVRLRFDGDSSKPTLVAFPEMDTPFAEEAALPTVLGTLARLTGHVPDGTSELTFGLSRAFGPARVSILEESTLQGARFVLGTGEDTPEYRLGETRAPARRGNVGLDYLVLGFQHIVPKGLDHMLFVLGLFLLSVRLRPLLWQVTAFTVAHSVTLCLSMAGVVSLPERVVEPLIALSIAYVALENLWTKEMQPWRPVLVFGFGLLHGLGFAGALRELGMPAGEFAVGLVAFNLGVELGQLCVILLALAAVGWFRSRPWYRSWIVLPLSIAIAITGLVWTVQRAL